METQKRFNRKSIRLKEYDYSQPGEYFITICTYKHKCIFGDIINEEMRLSEEGEIVQRCLNEIPYYYPNIELDTYVIMPNHIHCIINLIEPVGAIHESPLQMTQNQRRIMQLSKIVGRFKMTSAKKINIINNTGGVPVWQRNFYEHIIRNETDLINTRDYIINNPLKWFFDDENSNKF